MLSLMRKHAQSWLIKFVVGIIAIVFIFYFGYSFNAATGGKVAVVNGEAITGADYQKTYRSMLEALQREYKSVWNENLVKVFNVKGRALESLIVQKLVSQEAKKMGFQVTEKEVQEQIFAYPAFQSRGRFDEGRYRSLLQNNRMKPEDFEAELERELLQRKVEQFLGTFVTISEQDVLDYYIFSNEKVKISYVIFLPENYKGSVNPPEEEILKHFEENKEAYRIPEKIKVAYVVFNPEQFKQGIHVDEKEIQEYYDENSGVFKEEKEVKVRQILFKLPEGAKQEDDEKVQEKARSVLKKAKDGEDFAALAKKYSEDVPSKDKGGDLGYLKAGDTVAAVEEAAFKVKKGEVSDLVRSPFGYHILKVEDIKEARTPTLAEVREKIKTLLENQAATDVAHEKALSFQDQMPYQTDLRQFASQNKMEARESDYFSLDEAIPELGGDQKLRQSVFALTPEESSEVLEADGKFYMFQVTDRKASALPELSAVRDKVKKDLTERLAAQEAKAAAEKFLAKLKAGEPWGGGSKETRPQTTELFSRQNPAAEMGYNPAMIEASFGLSEKKMYPDKVFENEKGVFVIRYEGREGIDKEKFQEEKGKYEQSLTRARQRLLLENWLEGLKKAAEIKILIPPDREAPEF